MEGWVNGYQYRKKSEGMVGNSGTGACIRNRTRSDWLADCRYCQMNSLEGNIGMWMKELAKGNTGIRMNEWIVEILAGE